LTITERRKYQRVKTHNLLSYVCIDDSGNPTEERMGTAIEISQGGLFIETHNPLKPQDVLLITIDIQGELVPIKGRVVYCRTGDSGKLTKGIVKDVLTKALDHPYGIKVRLLSGEIGRVKKILE